MSDLNSPQKAFSLKVNFGSAFGVDEYGFVGSGIISLEDYHVKLEGKRQWSSAAQFGVFIGVLAILLILIHGAFGVIIDIFVAMGVMHYCSASPDSIKVPISDISEVACKGNVISFKSRDFASGKVRKSLFRAENEKTAADIASKLTFVKGSVPFLDNPASPPSPAFN